MEILLVRQGQLWIPWKTLFHPFGSAVPVVETVENFVMDAIGVSGVCLGSTGSLWPLAAAVYL